MDAGILSSVGLSINNPLPQSWLGLTAAPPLPPAWANIGVLTSTQVRNLLAQLGYDQSGWNYNKIGTNNELGRYQFTTTVLEGYGILATGSNKEYGTECVNYQHCWQPTYINNGINVYENYFYNVGNITSFLTNTIAQEHLAYQRIVDTYLTALNINVIQASDTTDVIAGMIYVCWTLGIGTAPTSANPVGTGAWAWRYYAVGNGANSFNSGRYAITVLS